MKKKHLLYSSIIVLFANFCLNTETQDHFDTIHWGVSARQGKRNYMEDYHTITHHEDKSETPQKPNFFGLYDGHGGSYIAEELKDTLHEKYYEACNDLSKEKALAKALSEIESGLRPENGDIDNPVNKAGSTAVIATLDEDTLYLANVGDSRAVVIRNGKIVFSTGDHKPHHQKELHRIYRGGYTLDPLSHGHTTPRIKGYSLSRAIGDWNTKIHYPQSLVATPDLYNFRLKPKDILIMASDGLWDVMTNEELAAGLPRLIEEYNQEAAREASITERKDDDDISVTERKDDDDILDDTELSRSIHFEATKDNNHEKTHGNKAAMRTIARTLRDYAHDARKSSDNITVIAVQFDKIPKPKPKRKKVEMDKALNLIIQNAEQLQQAIQNGEKNGLVGVLFNNLKEIVDTLAPEIVDYLSREEFNQMQGHP